MDAVSYGLLVEVKHKVLFMITTDRDADLTFDEYLQVCRANRITCASLVCHTCVPIVDHNNYDSYLQHQGWFGGPIFPLFYASDASHNLLL